MNHLPAFNFKLSLTRSGSSFPLCFVMNNKKHSLSSILSAVAQRDSTQLFAILDAMPDPTALPFICDVNRAGYDGHEWAWDQLEDWQTQD